MKKILSVPKYETTVLKRWLHVEMQDGKPESCYVSLYRIVDNELMEVSFRVEKLFVITGDTKIILYDQISQLEDDLEIKILFIDKLEVS